MSTHTRLMSFSGPPTDSEPKGSQRSTSAHKEKSKSVKILPDGRAFPFSVCGCCLQIAWSPPARCEGVFWRPVCCECLKAHQRVHTFPSALWGICFVFCLPELYWRESGQNNARDLICLSLWPTAATFFAPPESSPQRTSSDRLARTWSLFFRRKKNKEIRLLSRAGKGAITTCLYCWN